MKYSGLDVVQKIYDVLNSFKDEFGVEGLEIWKNKAPTNADNVNMVVSSLTTGTDTLQVSIININTYFKYINVNFGNSVTPMPDFEKIEPVDKKLSAIFAEYVGEDFIAYFRDSKLFEEENYSKLNFQIRVNLFNSN